MVASKEKGVAKYQFGEPCADAKEYVVLVVGATGAGKSTLINGLVNYIFGVQWEDKFRFKIIKDEGGASQAHSQTSQITAYTIHRQADSPFPHTFTIVDTPGFGDTKGLESDKRIVAQIKEFFSMSGQEGIDHIHGIGFVSQASLARLTHTQRYVFDSILAMFGKDIGSNILLMTTFADGKKPPVLEAVKAAGMEYCKGFKFNNSAIFAEDEGGNDESEDQSFDKMFHRKICPLIRTCEYPSFGKDTVILRSFRILDGTECRGSRLNDKYGRIKTVALGCGKGQGY